jgi:hypothetical protein
VDKSGVPPVDLIPPWLSMPYITWGMNNMPVGGHSSETYFHPIGMNIMTVLGMEGNATT